MSNKRKKLRNATKELIEEWTGAHRIGSERVLHNIEILQCLADSKWNDKITGDKKVDSRTRKMAAEFLIDHDLEVLKYLHPPEVKSKVTLDGGVTVNFPKKKPVGAPVE